MNELKEILSKFPAEEVATTLIREHYQTERRKIDATSKERHERLEYEKLKAMTPEEKRRRELEKDSLFYSKQLYNWSGCYCSWICPREWREETAINLIAFTAVKYPAHMQSLLTVFETSDCGRNQFTEIKGFLSKFPIIE